MLASSQRRSASRVRVPFFAVGRVAGRGSPGMEEGVSRCGSLRVWVPWVWGVRGGSVPSAEWAEFRAGGSDEPGYRRCRSKNNFALMVRWCGGAVVRWAGVRACVGAQARYAGSRKQASLSAACDSRDGSLARRTPYTPERSPVCTPLSSAPLHPPHWPRRVAAGKEYVTRLTPRRLKPRTTGEQPTGQFGARIAAAAYRASHHARRTLPGHTALARFTAVIRACQSLDPSALRSQPGSTFRCALPAARATHWCAARAPSPAIAYSCPAAPPSRRARQAPGMSGSASAGTRSSACPVPGPVRRARSWTDRRSPSREAGTRASRASGQHHSPMATAKGQRELLSSKGRPPCPPTRQE